VASLVIQAAALASGRDIFLLDTGDELRIADLAERMIRSRGMEPGKDIEIIYTGLRPGEKLSEALTGKDETQQATGHERVIAAVSDRTFVGAELRAAIRELEVDLRKRPGNLPARIHALARFDAAEGAGAEASEPAETRQEP
jgi:FlaA1/EpsC-like NDP-sugar epimerase